MLKFRKHLLSFLPGPSGLFPLSGLAGLGLLMAAASGGLTQAAVRKSSRFPSRLPQVLPAAPVAKASPSPLITGGPKTLKIRLRDDPETLDWNRAHTTLEASLLMNLMEGLVSLDADLKVVPALASRWEISGDGKVVTFYLQPGVKWSDGEPLRAQHFVDSWKRLLSPLTAAQYAHFLSDLEGVEGYLSAYSQGKPLDFSQVGVKALSDGVLQVRLKAALPHWIEIPAFWVTFPVREDLIQKYGSAWATPGRIVTLGPYLLESHEFHSKITLTRNPQYSGRRIGNVDRIEAMILPEDQEALETFDAGQLDLLTDLGTVDPEKLLNRPDLRASPHLKTVFLGFVTTKYPASEVHLRRAIAMALDRKKLNDFLRNSQPQATSFVPPGMLAYSKSVGLPFSLEQARAELKKAGWSRSQTLVITGIRPQWSKAILMMDWIAAELKKNLGIQLTFQSFEHTAYRTQLALHPAPVFYNTWTADFPDPENFLSLFLSSSDMTETTWSSPQFDQDEAKAKQAQSASERETRFLDLQRLLLEQEAVIVPLFYEPNLLLMKPALHLRLNALDFLYLKDARLEG